MRDFNPGFDYAQIVSYLLQGKSAREINRILGYKSSSTVQKKINRLAKHGYVVKHMGPDHPGITITLTGYTLLELLNQKGSTVEKNLTQSLKVEAPVEKSAKFFRLHALKIKYPYRERLPPENIHLITFRDHPTRLKNNLRNHVDLVVEFKDFNITVTTKSLIFTNLEVRLPYEEVEDPEILLEKARELFEPEVENIESILRKHIPRLALKRLAGNILDARVVKGEIALENDESAIKIGEIQKDSEEKFRIYDREDGKLSAIVDFSKGPAEFETVHPQKFVDKMRIWKAWADDLLSGDFFERQRKFQESLEAMQQIQKKQEELQANSFKQHDERIDQHLDLINNLATQFFHALDEMRQIMAQASGFGGGR